jgi:hypothetical protein
VNFLADQQHSFHFPPPTGSRVSYEADKERRRKQQEGMVGVLAFKDRIGLFIHLVNYYVFFKFTDLINIGSQLDALASVSFNNQHAFFAEWKFSCSLPELAGS